VDLALWKLRERISERIETLRFKKESLEWHGVYGPTWAAVVNPLLELKWVMAELELILKDTNEV
jgi:hypothetical protein